MFSCAFMSWRSYGRINIEIFKLSGLSYTLFYVWLLHILFWKTFSCIVGQFHLLSRNFLTLSFLLCDFSVLKKNLSVAIESADAASPINFTFMKKQTHKLTP